MNKTNTIISFQIFIITKAIKSFDLMAFVVFQYILIFKDKIRLIAAMNAATMKTY